jgi:hypothetical protein
MVRANMLREHAKLLRKLAARWSKTDADIRQQLGDLARQCDELSNSYGDVLAIIAEEPHGPLSTQWHR